MWLLIITTFIPLCSCTNNYVNVVAINKTGFHYEFQNTVAFVVNTWSFVLNIEYVVLKDRLMQLHNMSDTLLFNLQEGKELSNCTYTDGGGYKRELDYVINRKIANLYETHDSIDYLLIHKKLTKHNRKKRGLFGGRLNFMGRFYKYTIGLMDDNDAALLYEVAEHANNTDYRVKMLTNQTLNIAQYLNSIRHTLEEKVNCKYLERQLVYIKDNLEEIETTYFKILTGIQMALYSKRISSHIIKPRTLLTEMISVDSYRWDKESEWAVKPTFEQMHIIMQLLQCNVFINPKNELMFVIQVPRIDKTKYELYKPISVPDCDKNNICKYIAPKSQYIGFEKKFESKHYVRLEDISTCSSIDNLTLCYGSVTSKKIEYSHDCDVKLFKGSRRDNCAVHATKFYNEIFYSLNDVNRWLFMVGDKPIHAELNCGSGSYDQRITLQGTGLLTLLQYCKMRTSRSILTSKHIPNYWSEDFKVVHFDFLPFTVPAKYNLGDKIIKSLDYDTLNDVTSNLKQLINQEIDSKSISAIEDDDNSNAYWYANFFGNWWWELKFIVYVICVFVLLFIVFYVKRMCCGYHSVGPGMTTILPVLSPKYG
ncbi:F protein [Matsumuraeses phaseoli granulovirus]|uniref:F protein n=1 Tax=Matsumuraeses phaseoli granulovirus TaxID=2760664 RepID=A0AAE7MLA9_9BBAC|nr:F protein [Matsumuraeses phaseoli granulovirus]QOD39990.1 F protein [Matsumuraeses phaseoli granulovirus]